MLVDEIMSAQQEDIARDRRGQIAEDIARVRNEQVAADIQNILASALESCSFKCISIVCVSP